MANIYHGRAKLLEVHTSNAWAGSQIDCGEMKSCRIWSEKQVFEGLIRSHKRGVVGNFEAESVWTDGTTRTSLEALVDSDVYIRVTDPAGNTYVCGPAPLTMGSSRGFKDSTDPHHFVLSLKSQLLSQDSDWCEAPTDS